MPHPAFSRRKSALLLALTLVFGCHCQTKRPQTGPGSETPPGRPSAVLAESPLNPDARQTLLAHPAPGTGVPLQPPDGPAFRFVVDSVQPAGKATTYLGHVEGSSGSSGTLAVLGQTVAGTIRILGRPVYILATDRSGRPVIRAVDPSKLPPDHPEGFGSTAGGGPLSPPPIGLTEDTCSTDDPTRVTLMALYTQATRIAAGGTDAIEATIYAAIAEMNQSFVNSDVNVQIELVRLAETSYVSSGSFLTDVCRLHDPGDGFLDDVQAQRDTSRADLVVLFVPPSSSCGLTYGQLIDSSLGCNVATNHDVVRTPGNVHEEGAYHALAMDCVPTNFTLPHEIAHSFSARHNWSCDGSDNRPTHSNHGFFFDDGTAAGSWRTILTYNSAQSCGHNGPRVPYFSNPAISYLGHPTGTSAEPNPTDNHGVLNTTRAVLANYRCSAPPPANVWMKDSWGDTGAEPDPDPGIMYASPYVWTRHAADTLVTGFTDRYQHEHQHENPILHQPTFAYVKLHNSGATAASGHVKLYYANASTSLAWPGAWTLIGDVTVPSAAFAAGATKVVEIPWADPPGTGHYCLTARWESAADPIPPETADINANTRNSNNVIWRNLEILSMAGGDADTSFVARPLYGRTFALEFTAPGPRPFLPGGVLTVTLKASGASLDAKAGRGVIESGPGQYRIQASGGRIELVLPHVESAFVTVEVRFRLPAGLERRTYRVLINQFEENDQRSPAAIVGGMAYDLQP